MMEYKGYTALVEFDADDRVLHGKVAGIRDTVTFESEDVAGVDKAFQDSVDDYLAFCKERGVEPEHPFSGKFVLRISPDLHRSVAVAAEREHKSLNTWITDRLSASAG